MLEISQFKKMHLGLLLTNTIKKNNCFLLAWLYGSTAGLFSIYVQLARINAKTKTAAHVMRPAVARTARA